MAKKGGKTVISLIVSLALVLFGGLLVVSCFTNLPGFLSGIVSSADRNISIMPGKKGVMVPGIFLLFLGVVVLIFRGRKPFSYILIPYLALIYMTVVVFKHMGMGLSEPAFIISRIPPERRALLIAMILLEVVLGFVIMLVTAPLDRKWRSKSEERDAKAERKAQKRKEKRDGKKAIKAEKKAQEKAEREKEKAEKEENLKASQEAPQEEKSEEKAPQQKEKKQHKGFWEKKEKKAEEPKDSSDDGESTEDVSVRSYIPSRPFTGDDPLVFPEFRSIPTFKTLKPTDEELMQQAKDEASGQVVPSATMNLFQTMKDELEKKDEERQAQAEADPFEADNKPDENGLYRKGGILEASLEHVHNAPPSEQSTVKPGPIKGFEYLSGGSAPKEEKKEEPEEPAPIAAPEPPKAEPRTPSVSDDDDDDVEIIDEGDETPVSQASFAPSKLSPSHPRYKLFESLMKGKRRPVEQTYTPIKGEGTSESLSDAISNQKKQERLQRNEEQKRQEQAKEEEERNKALEEMQRQNEKIAMLEREVSSMRQAQQNASAQQYAPQSACQAPAPSVSQYQTQSPQPMPAPVLKAVDRDVHNSSQELSRSSSYFQDNATAKAVNGFTINDPKPEMVEDKGAEIEFKVGVGGLASNNAGEEAISKRAMMGYSFPPDDFLVDYPASNYVVDDKVRGVGYEIVNVMHDFRVEAKLINVVKGPTVTMYEFDLAPGIPVSRVTGLHQNIALRLGGKQIRMLAPIPGKSAIGVEVPNEVRGTVGFKELLGPLRAGKFNVPMVLGRDNDGTPFIIDVAKQPHMLIAGTTGSGKSVCINSLLTSIVYTKSPKQVRLILVDPKVVELQVYNGIPHLLTPVITDAKKVVKALEWLVEEMERRYRMFSQVGGTVRNIEGFNQKIHEFGYAAEEMPYIVLVMDEYADLMTQIKNEIETNVSRLMAKARAAGIHVILATQRPSAQVVTGIIKSNIPTRISFAASSSVNSKIILESTGAENLLGKGDMLFVGQGHNTPYRVQGAFMSDAEVEKVISFVKTQGEPDYLDESIFEDAPAKDEIIEDDYDDDGDADLYERAKQIVYERKGASASYLQRRLSIGYNKAARLVEQMEEDGIVGPANGSKPREILRYD